MLNEEVVKELNEIGYFQLNESEAFSSLSFGQKWKYLTKHRARQFWSVMGVLLITLSVIGYFQTHSQGGIDAASKSETDKAMPEVDLDLLKFKAGNNLRESCSPYEKEYCTVITKDDIALLCKSVKGITQIGAGTALISDPKAHQLLDNNQPFEFHTVWNEVKKKCVVKITQSGILDGSSIVRRNTGEAGAFIITKEGREVLVTYVDNSYYE